MNVFGDFFLKILKFLKIKGDSQMDAKGNNEAGAEKIIVYTVGTTPGALITSINRNKPGRVLFFPSVDTNDKISEVEKGLVWDGCRDKQVSIVKDPENLLSCVRQIRREVMKFLADRNLPPDTPLLADFTGGTKVMSAALALAMTEFQCNFCYVGGDVRSDDASHGTVVPGHEKIMLLENPWEALAVVPLMKLVDSFNNFQFGMAKDIIADIVNKQIRPAKFYAGLQLIIDGYAAWDAFDQQRAQKAMKNGLGQIFPYVEANEKIQPLYDAFLESYARLEIIAKELTLLRDLPQSGLPEEVGRPYLLDLVANARRRAHLGRYDDAVARLYSAIEKIAKIALLHYGRDNGNITAKDLADVSEEFRASIVNNEEDGKIKLGLKKSFDYLNEINKDDPLAVAYRREEEKLHKALQVRNQSLLAHGFQAVNKGNFNTLFDIVLRFMNVKEEDLPRFPTLTFDELMF